MAATRNVLPFTKMQAVGNDFVVLDSAHWGAGTDWRAVAVRLCDRKFGIGGDGLIVVSGSADADARMLFFNPDGTPDMCGNGLRCVVRYAVANGIAPPGQGRVESPDGPRAYRVDAHGTITTEMAPPKFSAAEIPVALNTVRDSDPVISVPTRAGRVDMVNTGSTHAVLWRDRLPDDNEFFARSPEVEHDPAFPLRTSVLWAVVEPPNVVRLRIWERGAGETMACGTGACAAAVLGRLRDRVEAGDVTVVSRGGTLSVGWDGDASAPVFLSGPADIVYTGLVSADAKN